MSNITNRLNKVLQTLDVEKVTDVAYKAFKENTPIRKGNARRNTKKQGHTINADYPYAQRLEEGYSKQAPKGMTEPTLEEVRQYVYTKLGVKI